MRIGVILDGDSIARWQARALETLAGDSDFILYSCSTSLPAKRHLKHVLYYLLNLFTIRNHETRKIPLPPAMKVIARHSFQAPCEGSWQSLPPALLHAIRSDAPDVMVKFGMGLLRVPPPEQLALPILSYHHGDPAKYRGRPAGFYELLRGETTVGQVVQVLSDRLDCGKIAASAETPAIAHSYRATLLEAYRVSHLLLGRAIRRALADEAEEEEHSGPAYRLPSNLTTLQFIAGRIGGRLAHLIYGLTRSKRWQVATIAIDEPPSIETLVDRLAEPGSASVLTTPAAYRFLADPFIDAAGDLLVEGLNAKSGRGEILRIGSAGCRRVSGRGGHYSYPAVIGSGASTFVVPEVSDWSSVMAYPLGSDGLGKGFELQVPGRPRLLDPTPFEYGDAVYLFANVTGEGQSVLRLWVSDRIDGIFVEHPASPIRISPNGSRMGGIPFRVGNDLIRVGQDLRRGYGDGITFFQVTRLDPQAYAEEQLDGFRFSDRRGPHTLNRGGGRIAFDFYRDQFSLLAGWRRLRERRAAGKIGE